MDMCVYVTRGLHDGVVQLTRAPGGNALRQPSLTICDNVATTDAWVGSLATLCDS
eukprot:m.141892 g.141892  ORF g.141892 m.141892 type:complete len:55 (+) comp11571_c0_seq1:1-165(+)